MPACGSVWSKVAGARQHRVHMVANRCIGFTRAQNGLHVQATTWPCGAFSQLAYARLAKRLMSLLSQ